MLDYKKYIENLKISIDDIETKKESIDKISETLVECFKNGNKLLVCGNGGSCSDASHFVGELTCTYKNKNKRGLPAIDLGSSMTALTAWGNDFSFETFFERQVKALGKPNDILFCISTGGGNKEQNVSMNIVHAAKYAKENNMKVISLIGKSGGELKKISDISFVAKANETSHVQETHIIILHMLCEKIDLEYGE